MESFVFMSPNNGALCLATPLYKRLHTEHLVKLNGFFIALSSDKPMAYAIDIGEAKLSLMSADWVEKNLECLGEI